MNIILSSKIPIFEQIVQTIKMYIDSSILKEDEKLPVLYMFDGHNLYYDN